MKNVVNLIGHSVSLFLFFIQDEQILLPIVKKKQTNLETNTEIGQRIKKIKEK